MLLVTTVGGRVDGTKTTHFESEDVVRGCGAARTSRLELRQQTAAKAVRRDSAVPRRPLGPQAVEETREGLASEIQIAETAENGGHDDEDMTRRKQRPVPQVPAMALVRERDSLLIAEGVELVEVSMPDPSLRVARDRGSGTFRNRPRPRCQAHGAVPAAMRIQMNDVFRLQVRRETLHR